MSAPYVELDELYRMSTDEYHRLIEAGAFEDFPSCELIDGLLVRKDVKSPEHENAIAWLMQWLMFAVDQRRWQVRVGCSLTLAGSEPEPDLMVIRRDTPRPYHPETAALAIEVSRSSLRRDLNRKAALYAEAGVEEYWVFDVEARRVVVHRVPHAAATATCARCVEASASSARRPGCRSSWSTSCWQPPTARTSIREFPTGLRPDAPAPGRIREART